MIYDKTDEYDGMVPPYFRPDFRPDFGSEGQVRDTRTFGTGATRDVDDDKLDFEGFLSPLAMEMFARYMHGKRLMPDGSVRDSDNWQKGIPLDAYMKSMWRHFFDVWCHHRGLHDLATEPLETALAGLFFNVQGYSHEMLKQRTLAEAEADLRSEE